MKRIKIQDIAGQEEMNKVMNDKTMSWSGKKSIISRTTGLCQTCRERPSVKLVLIKIPGAYRIERYCLEHFHYSDYETKKRVKK